MRHLYRLIGLIALAVLFVALWFVCKAIYLVHLAERDYSLTVFVFGLVEDYVTEYGAWPRSWHDLEQVERSEAWNWPEDSPSIQRRITVDFNVDVDELARQSVDQFEAIRPVQRNELFEDNEIRRPHIESLLKTVRRLASENEKWPEKDSRQNSNRDGSAPTANE